MQNKWECSEIYLSSAIRIKMHFNFSVNIEVIATFLSGNREYDFITISLTCRINDRR